jgi:hypothetical protein
VVEAAHDRGDVRLEEAVAHDEQAERTEEGDAVLDRHHEVAGGHEHAAEDHRAALAEDAIGEHAADEGRHVDERGVGAVDRVGAVVAVTEEALRHVEDEQGAHAVVAEALPHLREEQDEEPGWVTHAGFERGDGVLVRARRTGAGEAHCRGGSTSRRRGSSTDSSAQAKAPSTSFFCSMR